MLHMNQIRWQYLLLKLSANSPKSIDRTHRINRWFVQTIGSMFSLSDCKRRIANACRSYFISRNKWMPWTMLAWWNLRVTPKYFSSSFFDSVSNMRASTSECINDSEYCESPISCSHSSAHHLRHLLDNNKTLRPSGFQFSRSYVCPNWPIIG